MARARPRSWSVKKVRALGMTTDVVTAGSVLGLGRTVSYQRAREGRFPVPVRKVGDRYLVVVADLLQALGVDPDERRGRRK
jgi:hypothetical protein